MKPPTEYTDEFMAFWKKFPARWSRTFQGGSYIKRKKRPAFDKWQTLSPAIRAECLYKVKYIKSSEGDSARDCVTWLNQYGWEDIEMEVPAPAISKEMADKVLKDVPQGDKRSKSDKVNEQLNDLGA